MGDVYKFLMSYIDISENVTLHDVWNVSDKLAPYSHLSYLVTPKLNLNEANPLKVYDVITHCKEVNPIYKGIAAIVKDLFFEHVDDYMRHQKIKQFLRHYYIYVSNTYMVNGHQLVCKFLDNDWKKYG